MAATGKTPILLYGSTTPTNAPAAGNLTNSSDGCEIAINVADKNLFFKDSTNAVNTVPIRQSSGSSNGWLSSTDWTTFNNKVSSQWTTSGSNVYYSSGSVGIGVAPSSWGGVLSQSLEFNNGFSISNQSNFPVAYIQNNAYFNGSAWIYKASNYATQYVQNASGTATHVWNVAASGTAGGSVTWVEQGRWDAGNNFQIANGNLTIVTAGKGIDFSATAGTGTSELLADYEEGTWTPSVGGSATYTTQIGKYTKVGRMVHIDCELEINVIGSGSTSIISGLPYNGVDYSSITVGFFQNLATSTLYLNALLNGSSLILTSQNAAGVSMNYNPATFGNSSRIIFSATYQV